MRRQIPKMIRRQWLAAVAAISAAVLSANSAETQGVDAAYVSGRLDLLQRSIAELSARLEHLKAQDQQLQQRMERMQANLNQRIERLEAGGKPTPAPRAAPARR